MSIGEMIKKRRKQLSVSPEQLAERIGKSPATVYRYENGDIDKVDSRVLLDIAVALNTTPAYLMEMTDDPAARYFSDMATYVFDVGQNSTDITREEFELLTIYRELNATGKNILINTARGIGSNADFKQDGASSEITA